MQIQGVFLHFIGNIKRNMQESYSEYAENDMKPLRFLPRAGAGCQRRSMVSAMTCGKCAYSKAWMREARSWGVSAGNTGHLA